MMSRSGLAENGVKKSLKAGELKQNTADVQVIKWQIYNLSALFCLAVRGKDFSHFMQSLDFLFLFD